MSRSPTETLVSVTPRIRAIINRLASGELALNDACGELARLAAGAADSGDEIARVLQAQLESSRITPQVSDALLEAVRRSPDTSVRTVRRPDVPVATTQVRMPPPEPLAAPTQMRTPPPEPLAAPTQMRPPPPDPFATPTQMRPQSQDPFATPTQMRPSSSEPLAAPTQTRPPPPAPSGPLSRPAIEGFLSPAPAVAAPPATSIDRFEPGAVLKDRFVLESLIGRGGMGIVFSAQDRRKQEAQDPNPRVAIKILNADFRGHPQALMALQREAHKAQSLAHPNVVTVFDFDRDGATVFMTMELLQGQSLEALVRDARGRGIGRERALPIIRGMADGLAYAHRKGIVHSDLKPGNVFLLEDGTPKLLDFGIARAVPASAAAAGPRDVFDAGALGAYTVAYATQEMIDGGDPHPAHDLYALGLIAYELLTGRHAFGGASVTEARARGLRPAPVKELRRREWRALERCLSFEEARRPRDATEFIRQFFGVTPLQKSMLAAVIVLILVSAWLMYRNYVDAGPATPFSNLPVATQQEFRRLVTEGDQEWGYYERDHNTFALWSSVERYADAYQLHPRNRDAVRGLERAADAFLKLTGNNPEQQHQVAKDLGAKSEYLSKYPPIIDASAGP